jgi:dephospho-CoA kinase
MFPNAVTGRISLRIDRKKISDIVFSDRAMHKKLTDTITPLVLEEIKNRTKKLSKPIFVEVPLLFECGYEDEFDGVLIITRPLEKRVESVKKRSKLTEEQIFSRIKAQIDYDTFDFTPYYVIENDDDLSVLNQKVLSLLKDIVA